MLAIEETPRPPKLDKGHYWRQMPKAPRRDEKIGGGFFVFRRGDYSGRIKPCMWPFEHSNYDSALTEAMRLQAEFGGQFDVLGIQASVGGTIAQMETAA